MTVSLIVGGDSAIGSAYKTYLQRQGEEVLLTSRRHAGGEALCLDLATDPAHWPPFPVCGTAYLCAAIVKLDRCKADPQGTRLINVERMQEVARRLQDKGAFLVFLSSNQVFDGGKPYRKAKEPQGAVNEYGRQKAEFEQWLLHSGHPAAVLRLTKVIAARLPLLEKWEAALRKGETVEAFGDLRFAPLPLSAVLQGMRYVGAQKKPGIYQLSGVEDVSYFEIAVALAKRLNVNPALVVETSARQAGIAPEALPKHGTLDRATLSHISIPPALEVVLGETIPSPA